ncbi:MAG TPA: helix-turn-helix transcriptional regulator [Rectinemataceae bacterium]|nr:helix-turn-helix transcriptional regulator [Rectinemataceae bacterium]
MSEIDAVIRKRSAKSPTFAAQVESELAELRVGLIVKELRQKNNLTQEELAKRIKTTKSAISRLENSTGGARLETLEKVALAFGKELVIEFR